VRRAVVLPVLGLLLLACSSTVPGRPVIDRAAPPHTAADSPTPTAADVPTEGDPTPTADATSSGEPTTTADTAPAATLPEGFYPAGSELGYRPMSTDEFDCAPEQPTGCFGFMVFSAPGCPAGAGVTVGIFDKAVDPDNPIGTAAGTTPPIDANGSQSVVIGDSTGVPANLTARVQQVVC
jgi:hypothetical protein